MKEVRRHPAASNFVLTVPRHDKSFPVLGSSLPAGAIPIFESSAVSVLHVPEGKGSVVVSTLNEKFDEEIKRAILAQLAPPEPLDHLLYDNMYVAGSNSVGEPGAGAAAAKGAKGGGTRASITGTKAFEHEDPP